MIIIIYVKSISAEKTHDVRGNNPTFTIFKSNPAVQEAVNAPLYGQPDHFEQSSLPQNQTALENHLDFHMTVSSLHLCLFSITLKYDLIEENINFI